MDNSDTFIIRPVKASDEPDWRRLWTAYLEFYETALSDEIYASTFKRLLSGEENEFKGLIAELDGKPIGLVHYLFHRSCWSVENSCYLQDLFVDPHVRGKSYGRALIEAVYNASDEAGCPGVYWQTQNFNEAGRRLYDRVAELSEFVVYNRPGYEA